MAERTLYVCKNPACTLGTPQRPGRFTGGMTAEQKNLLTGEPLESLEKGKDYGSGVCPNCGTLGEEFDSAKAQKSALAEAKAQYDAQVAAIREGVA